MFAISLPVAFFLLASLSSFALKWNRARHFGNVGNFWGMVSQETTTSATYESNLQKEVEHLLQRQAEASNMVVKSTKWVSSRCEVILDSATNNEASLSSDVLGELHNNFYESLSEQANLATILEKTEFLLSSPGIGEVVRTEKDFISFKGFPVCVQLRNPIKGNEEIKGTLIGRDASFISISLKGRIVKIPREEVIETRLPKAKYEHDDHEARKLQ